MTLRFNGKYSTRSLDTTIASSGTQSTAVAVDGEGVVGILCPSALTSSMMSFQFSEDGENWYDAYGTGGEKLNITIGASYYIALSPADLVFSNFIRLVTPSAEAAERVFYVYTRTYT